VLLWQILIFEGQQVRGSNDCCTLLNRIPTVQACDARMFHSSNVAQEITKKVTQKTML